MKRFIVACSIIGILLTAGCSKKPDDQVKTENSTNSSISSASSTAESSEKEKVQLPNPFTAYQTVDEAKEAFGAADFLIPNALPEGYSQDAISVMKQGEDRLFQIIYKNGNDRITYRVMDVLDGSIDERILHISGDYNQYPESDERRYVISALDDATVDITARGTSGEISVVYWQFGNYSYSITAAPGIAGTELETIISNSNLLEPAPGSVSD